MLLSERERITFSSLPQQPKNLGLPLERDEKIVQFDDRHRMKEKLFFFLTQEMKMKMIFGFFFLAFLARAAENSLAALPW